MAEESEIMTDEEFAIWLYNINMICLETASLLNQRMGRELANRVKNGYSPEAKSELADIHQKMQAVSFRLRRLIK